MQLLFILLLVVAGSFFVLEVPVSDMLKTPFVQVSTSTVSTRVEETVPPTSTLPKKKEVSEPKKAVLPTQKKTAEPATTAQPQKTPTKRIPINLSAVEVTEQASSTGAVGAQISIPALELRIHELINKERVALGLTVLEWQPGLLAIARGHSADMATRGYFAHNSPEGESFSGRYVRGGFTCEIRIENTIYLGGENLFKNNFYDSWEEVNGVRTYKWNSLERVAATTVYGWMQSPGHRANILKPYWRSEAIGIAYSSDDRIYITQNFC